VRTDRSGQSLVVAGGLLAFLLLGWTGLLLPALIREVEQAFAINDADMGMVFLLGAATFTAGSLFAGWAATAIGRRPLLLGGVALLAVGSAGVLIPSWPVFLLTTVLRGLGSGIIEVAIQGLFLAAFTGPTQGRAINMVHFCYSVGAALTPIAVAALIDTGLTWPTIIALTTVPWLVAGGLLAAAPMDGRAARSAVPAPRLRPTVALVAAAVAIAFYVAAEVGVSSWLVRFLADAPLGLAATALSLFWAALAVSRLVTARFGTRVAPEALAIGGFIVAAVAVVGAVLIGSVELSIALFAVTGFAFGPIYAGIILLGSRIPGRTDAVTGILASSGVAGATVYPPLMGLISVGPGLGVAMGGTAILSACGAGLVATSVRSLRRLDQAAVEPAA
jgi:fucose permease